MVVLVPSKNLNPENNYYYQWFDPGSYKDCKATEAKDTTDQRKLVKNCEPKSKE